MRHTSHPFPWRYRDMVFLAMAVAVHVALLLIPLKPWERDDSSSHKRLTIKLQTHPAIPELEPEPAPVTENTATPPPTETIQRKPHPANIQLDEIPIPPEQSGQPAELTEAKENSAEISAGQLRFLVRQSELMEPEAKTSQQLGHAKQYQAPANWSRNAGAPYLAEFDNRFNGMTVPEKVEIVDRWLAADGSHNVVVNLPNGLTLCGRAEAYNPMQPLVEPIMLFGSCGGGGKRTFSMPDRYNKDR